MTSKLKYLLLSVLAAGFLSVAHAGDEPDPARLGREKEIVPVDQIKVESAEGKQLGRIKDIVIDLDSGRIVEVLVRHGGFMGMGGRIIAVPPAAFAIGLSDKAYRLNVTEEKFKAAPAVDMANWTDAGRSDRVAAVYHYFGFEPYFLETDARVKAGEARPKVPLGYIERSSKLMGLPVRNKQNEELGRVKSVAFDVSTGRVLHVIVRTPGFYNERRVIPSMALRCNAVRNGLVLDDTAAEFADEPRVAHTDAGNGQPAFASQESYQGPKTSEALEQGGSYRDADRSKLIKRKISAAKLESSHVEVGTLNGRVTLRGWVQTAADRDLVGEIAIQASRVELVDNQITVGESASQ